MAKKPQTIAKSLLVTATDPEAMACAIVDIARAMQALQASRLTRRAVALLIKDDCGVSLENIKLVLDSAQALDKTYLKPKES